MFLHLCVILFTGGFPLPSTADGDTPPRGQTPLDLDRDPTLDRDPHPRDWHLVGATEAGGTHPSGMHVCLFFNLSQSSSFSILSLLLFQKHSVDMLNFEEHLSCRKLHYCKFLNPEVNPNLYQAYAADFFFFFVLRRPISELGQWFTSCSHDCTILVLHFAQVQR